MTNLSAYFAPLASLPAVPFKMRGEWAQGIVRRYDDASQLGSGAGPYVEVAQWHWEGSIGADVPLVGLLGSGDRVVKVDIGAAPHIPLTLAGGPSPDTWTLGDPTGETGRVHLVARTDKTAIWVLPLLRAHVKVGRNRLWRLRPELAVTLPTNLRTLLERGRVNNVPALTSMP